jgi:hypothetical protein
VRIRVGPRDSTPGNQEFKVISENGKSWLRIENHDAGRQLDYVHADAELPSGMTLNWDKTSIVTVNAKRAQVSLAGIWRIIPAAEGTAEPPKVGWAYIKVPGSWQNSQGRSSDIVARGGGPQWDLYDGARVARAWYQRQVPIPAEWQGRAISLRFDRVCTDAMVYVNGTECGTIAWPWGSVDVTSAVTPGQMAEVRVLVAAIADAEQAGTFWQNALSSTVTFTSASLRSERSDRHNADEPGLSDSFLEWRNCRPGGDRTQRLEGRHGGSGQA